MKKLAIILILLLIAIPSVAVALKAILSVSPVDGYAPLTIYVGEISGDPEIVDWKFDFGDGTIIVHESRAEHTYEKAGDYVLELGVLDAKGNEVIDKTIISVYDDEHPPTPRPTDTPDPEETPTPEETKPTPTPTTTIEPTEPNEFTTQKLVYQGATPIKDSLAAKSPTTSDASVLKSAALTAMSKETYPYDIVKPVEAKTEFKIVKFRCEAEICGYWIEAYRDGYEVQVNNPIWISPPPYLVVVSSTYDAKLNEETFIVKEDPKLAMERVLQRYVDAQPIGKAVTGTKE